MASPAEAVYCTLVPCHRADALRVRLGTVASPVPPPRGSLCSTSDPLGTERSFRQPLGPLASIGERDNRATVPAKIPADGERTIVRPPDDGPV